MHMLRLLTVLLFTALAPFGASANTYPDRPVRMIVPYPAGGGTDALDRKSVV